MNAPNPPVVQFQFRLWVHPVMGDPPEIEIWWHGLEQCDVETMFVTDWIKEAMEYENFHALLDLDKNKHWQVIGRAELKGEFCHSFPEEYDEVVTILEYEKAEVPESFTELCCCIEEGEVEEDVGN